MILYLECRSYGIALDIPTTRDEAASTIFSLIAGFEDEPAEISISGVNSPIPNLYPYVQHADLESGADLEKLNTLDARINGMTQEEQHLFPGRWNWNVPAIWTLRFMSQPAWTVMRYSLKLRQTRIWAAFWWTRRS